jgi:hypothetical protein
MRKIKPQKIERAEVSLEPAREIFPHFGISLEHLPEAKKWKVGETYYVALELKQTDLSVHSRKEEEHGHVGFEITGLEVLKGYKKDAKELPDKED